MYLFKWKKEILFDRKHIIGNYEIDNKRKSYCPGELFPWERLMGALVKPLEEQIQVLKEKGIITDSKYWVGNAQKGETIKGEYAAILIQRMVALILKGEKQS